MGRRGRPRHPDILTPREWEVLALLREHLTNEAIAERLGVTHAAAKYHISEILSKLGVSTREEAAAWQPEAERRPWWAAAGAWLRPMMLAKAALAAASVVALAGLGVLAWGVLRSSGDESPITQGRIAFVSDRDGDYDVWLVNEDGSGLRRLTDFGVNPQISNLAWSEDGRYLVFNERETVYVTEVEPGKTWSVTAKDEPASAVGFEAGGDRILVRVDGAITSMDLQGKQRLAVAAEPAKLVSSKGDRLEVASQGSPAGHYFASQLFVIRADRDERVRLAPDLGLADSPAWSPDGSLIVFQCGQGPMIAMPGAPTPAPGDIGGICTIRPDGGGLTEVVHGAYEPQWSPDGSWLIYRKPSLLYVARPNGEGERPLTGCQCQESDAAWWQPAAARSTATGPAAAMETPAATRSPFPTVTAGDRPRLLRGVYKVPLDRSPPQPLLVSERLTGGRFGFPEMGASPDGQWVALSRGTDRGLDIVNTSTGEIRTVTLVERVYQAAIAPGGSRMLVSGSQNGREAIYDVDLEAGTTAALAASFGSGLQWSPVGESVAFRGGGQGTDGIYVADLSTGAITLVASGGIAFSWASDGRSLAVARSDGLYVASLAGELTPVKAMPLETLNDISLSPDGRTIAYDEMLDPAAGYPYHWQITLVSTVDGSSTVLGPGQMPAWSPDGGRLAYVLDGALYAWAADGSGEQEILKPHQPFMTTPHWLSDGSAIIAAYAPPVAGSIYAVRADDGRESLLAHGYSPSWSPDGQWVAFVGNGSGSGLGGTSEIDVMRRDGTDLRYLTRFDWSDVVACGGPLDILWSPDGRYIAYADSSGRMSIVSLDSSPAPAIDSFGCGLSWSPDGLRLAHSASIFPDNNAMAILDVPSGASTTVTREAGQMAWSPDGAEIAFTRSDGYYVIASDGTGERKIAAVEVSQPQSLRWSPDGRRLLISSWHVSAGASGGDYSVTVIDVESGETRDLAEGYGSAWSPDGRQITFVHGVPSGVYVVGSTGGEPRLLSTGSQCAWSPDGGTVLVVRP